MNNYVLLKTANLLKIGIFLLDHNALTPLMDNAEQNPLYQSENLRNILLDGANKISVPFIYRDNLNIYYTCIKSPDNAYFIGPMATQYLNRIQRHEYYKKMNVELDLDKNMRLFSINEILQTVCIMGNLITGRKYDDETLLALNHLTPESREQVHVDEIKYDLKTEDDEESYRHSYHEERHLLEAVREGNVEEALKRNKDMDMDIGKLSDDDVEHWRNVLVIGATLCARAAIEGGLAPYTAYRISGYYINRGSNCKDALQIFLYRNQAVEELTKAVHELKTKNHVSSYTLQCKDYIRKHYRDKIYLEELASHMKISSSYLSRTFKKETGENLQDYIVGVRVEKAANLLKYSEEPLSHIAEYVNFPSQSYFGRIFKEKKGMTPREYRETFKPIEFIDSPLNIN